MLKSNKFQRQKKMAYSIFGIGFILLLLANTLAWLYLQRVRGFFITDLAFRLENIAQISGKLIDPGDLTYIMPDNPSDPAVIYYQQMLSEIRENNNLQDIYILSPAREILVEIPGEFGGSFTRHDIESDLVERAIGGNLSTGALQSLGTHKFMTTLAPITDANNIVVGILVVEAPADFFDVIEQFNNGLIIFSGVTIAVILMVAYLLWYAFRRLISIQEQMQDQEHLVKLGEMAASVAHEIRNPLSIIQGANSLIQKKYAHPEDEFFNYIPAELNRLNKLIDDFLSFARIRDPEITTVNLQELVEKVKIGFDRSSNIQYKINISDKIGTLKTDAGMLEQILLNILTNSQQALLGKGQIGISAELANEQIRITIDDDGPGIDHEIVSRIFEPFFSTKDSGSGLGLAISKRLTEQLKGSLDVLSQPGKGTKVRLNLPVDWKRL